MVAVLLAISSAPAVLAQSSSSSNYQVVQSEFGSGSTEETCSGNYCSMTSIGNPAAGESTGTANTAKFGSITDSEPMLEVIVDPGESDLGTLTTETTASKTMVVRVRNYLSSGYVLQITGDPPKYGDHTLATPSTPTASDPGTEQFALNVADNTTPDVGAAPVQVPSGEFSFGVVDDDYKTPDLYMYSSGDVIARSASSSGQTDYTISMIINISNATPAGRYMGDFAAVVIPVY